MIVKRIPKKMDVEVCDWCGEENTQITWATTLIDYVRFWVPKRGAKIVFHKDCYDSFLAHNREVAGLRPYP